jgi:Right handed beta helix region
MPRATPLAVVLALASLLPAPDSAAQQQPIVPGVPVLPIPTSPLDLNTRTLHVGPGADYATPSAAAAAAHDGDRVEIAGGDYHGDVAVWSASRLRIVGVKTRPRISADGNQVQGKGIWVVRGDDIVVENVEMSGARVPDGNGAAIRLEGRNFVLRDAYLHDNEEGILSGANPTSEVTIEHCEFARNGSGDGRTHNVYIGAIAKLTVSRSYLHHAISGHNLKSRAAVTVVTDNRLADEADGRASYEADFPNGGKVTLAFNIFQKGASSENDATVAYGEEGLAPDGAHELIAKGNTFVSQRPNGVRFLAIAPGKVMANVNGNVFAGVGTLPDIANIRTNNAVQREMPGNVDLKPNGF